MEIDQRMIVRAKEELNALYPPPLERAVRKQLDRLDEYCRAFIAASPLFILATMGAGPQARADNSPRGDKPGFVQVADDSTLLIPDRRGNNRTDSLHNILVNPQVGLLFLVPGAHETFRVNGKAVISRDPVLLDRFAMDGKLPRTVIVIEVLEAYIHCARALVRADVWNPQLFAASDSLPSFGTVMAAHTGGFVNAAVLDEDNRLNLPATLY